MQSTRAKTSTPRTAKRSFTWGVQANEVGWMKSGVAIEGSTSSDCTAGCAASPTDKPRRKKPGANGAL